MERKSFLSAIFIVLLVSPASIMAKTLEEVNETRNKRQAQALLPIASYAGLTVSAPVFAALVTVYGAYALYRYNIRRRENSYQRIRGDHDSHSCANNRGWCRPTCFSHEYTDWFNNDVCGSYRCCRPGRRG
uniref:Big defensin 1 n=1 Tax=Magallana gigas TaxID=29159 RepID=F6M2H8_MAGGI|nr:big defensin 1 [Crassostrea gigas]